MTIEEYFDAKVSSDIMYNEPRRIVSIFKDYLIFDDFSEYLKRSYQKQETCQRLPRMIEYYQTTTTKFNPSIVALGAKEQKYILKNIQKKQRLLESRDVT